MAQSKTHGEPTKGKNSDMDLNVFLDEIRDAGMVITNSWKTMWRTAVSYAWGQQLRGIRPKEGWEYIVINRIYPLMFQNIAKLSKNNPKIIAQAWDEEKDGTIEFVERWAGILQYIWESPYELNMRLKLIKGLLDSAVFGYMVGKVYWDGRVTYDSDKNRWIGNVRHTFVHPTHFWTEPGAESMTEAENCGTVRRVKLEWAQNRWPKSSKDIEKEAYTSEDSKYNVMDIINYTNQKAHTVEKNKSVYSHIVDLILNKALGQFTADSGSDKQRYVNVEEIYWRDYSSNKVQIKDKVKSADLVNQGIITIEEETGLFIDTKTGELYNEEEWPEVLIDEYDKPVFPHGRFVSRVGNVILNPKEEDQKYEGSRWPFTIMPYHILPHMWQGGNAIEMGRNNNDILNMTVSSLVNQVRRTADPIKIIEKNTLALGRDGKVRQTNPFGLGKIIIVGKGKVDKLRDWIHPPVDAAVIQLAALLKQDIDDNSFSQPISRGEISKGQTTKAEAIRANVNSHDYTVLQGVFLDGFIDDTVTLIGETVQRHYEPGRLVRIISEDSTDVGQMDEKMLDLRFDANIIPGSTLPFDEERKQARYLQAYELVNQPIPNPMIQETLRVLDITDRKKILAKYKGLQLFHQFIAMGQQILALPPEQGAALLVKMSPEAQAILQPIIQLLAQAGQLAPQIGVGQNAKG